MTAIGETLVFHLGLIGDLPDEDREAVTGLQGEERKLKRHEDILRTGDIPTYSIVVLEGLPNTRPINLSPSPRCQRSQISALSAAVTRRRRPFFAIASPHLANGKVLLRSPESTVESRHSRCSSCSHAVFPNPINWHLTRYG